jgi:hypothetical protein
VIPQIPRAITSETSEALTIGSQCRSVIPPKSLRVHAFLCCVRWREPLRRMRLRAASSRFGVDLFVPSAIATIIIGDDEFLLNTELATDYTIHLGASLCSTTTSSVD